MWSVLISYRITYVPRDAVEIIFLLNEHVENLNNIVIKKSETNNNNDVKENGNEKVNKMKEVVSKDIKETSTGNRTYRDVCAIGK